MNRILFPIPSPASPANENEGRLLRLAALFLFLYSIILTVSPVVRLHSWPAPLRWTHWIGFAVWFVLFTAAHYQARRYLPDHDPYLIPITSLLTGWGLLTIFRLYESFGYRQTIWLTVCVFLLIAGMRTGHFPEFLKRYRYLWLTASLLLTGLTFLFGTYPYLGSAGPRLWLGCCGIYLQPSEPLKLLLVAYLAAYLADQPPISLNLLHLILPTFVLTGSALLLLVAQRDLGTASLLIILYAVMLFLATNRRTVIWGASALMTIAAAGSYFLFDVVRLRINAWLNPWLDPLGRSYQIVQSLIAVASGGIIGRGPGLGSPGVVPVSHSDFIFASIAEETGLIGTAALILLLAFMAVRGLTIAMQAGNLYQRYLAAGLTAMLVMQSLLIIGGNLRLLPLTGVTLPFVSYGGSSLLTSFAALLLLLLISGQTEQEAVLLNEPRPYLLLAGVALTGLLAALVINGWWSSVRSDTLTSRSDNPRWAINDRYVPRGNLMDRNGLILNGNQGVSGSFSRLYHYVDLAPIIGYTNSMLGQSGIEAALDPYLRGIQGNPASTVFLSQLLTGQPPTGLDVRLSLSLPLQRQADELLGDHHGAVVLVNAETGEILVMASHPGFDPNTLVENWQQLNTDQNAPLLNRATQGLYPPGTALAPFFLAQAYKRPTLPALPGEMSVKLQGGSLACAGQEAPVNFNEAAAGGCPAAQLALAGSMDAEAVQALYRSLGLYTPVDIAVPSTAPAPQSDVADLRQFVLGQEDLAVTPVQMTRAAAILSSGGAQPALRLALSVHTNQQGWIVLASSGQPVSTLSSDLAARTAQALARPGYPIWQSLGSALSGPSRKVTWYLGGTLPSWQGTPLALVVLLEEDNPELALHIGESLLLTSQQP